jgi:hypothetical protein
MHDSHIAAPPEREVSAIHFADGSRVQPTRAGVEAIERLVRNGRSLAEATVHITGGPRMFADRKGI